MLTALGATHQAPPRPARPSGRTFYKRPGRCNLRRLAVEPKGVVPHGQLDHRALEGWVNYKSAEEEADTLEELIGDYLKRGFCSLAYTQREATEILGGEPVLNKLGVLVKEKKDASGKVVKKARVIWDLRVSAVNTACHQGKRIILPRLLDVVSSILASYRRGKAPYLAGVDIRDAFMNIRAGRDRRFTAAAVPGSRNRRGKKRHRIILTNTLVFGSASSPTVWGRAAAWLGRSSAAVSTADLQCYVDDPVYVLDGPGIHPAANDLALVLLWTAVSGFPVKLSKARGARTSNGWAPASGASTSTRRWLSRCPRPRRDRQVPGEARGRSPRADLTLEPSPSWRASSHT